MVYDQFFQWILSLPDAVVLLWEDRASEFRDFGKHIRNISVIPNAVDLDQFDDNPHKKFDGTDLNMGYIGRLTSRKGVHECIGAIAILSQEMGLEGAHLSIAGTGPEQQRLRA